MKGQGTVPKLTFDRREIVLPRPGQSLGFRGFGFRGFGLRVLGFIDRVCKVFGFRVQIQECWRGAFLNSIAAASKGLGL